MSPVLSFRLSVRVFLHLLFVSLTTYSKTNVWPTIAMIIINLNTSFCYVFKTNCKTMASVIKIICLFFSIVTFRPQSVIGGIYGQIFQIQPIFKSFKNTLSFCHKPFMCTFITRQKLCTFFSLSIVQLSEDWVSMQEKRFLITFVLEYFVEDKALKLNIREIIFCPFTKYQFLLKFLFCNHENKILAKKKKTAVVNRVFTFCLHCLHCPIIDLCFLR